MAQRGKRDIKVPLKLFRQLAASYPVYCGNGNHENRMVWERSLYGDLYEEYRGCHDRHGRQLPGGQLCFLGKGLEDCRSGFSPLFLPEALYQRRCHLCPRLHLETETGQGPSDCKEEPLTILLAHSPLYFLDSPMPAGGADLTLAGHFHGGTIRIPGLGEVMTLGTGFFLPWCARGF